MPGMLEYTCKSCSHREVIMTKDFFLGPEPLPPPPSSDFKAWERDHFRWLSENTRTFVCDSCWVMLTVPYSIALSDWEKWKVKSTDGPKPHTNYPFLQKLVSLIDHSLREHKEAPFDIGEIGCPYGRTVLLEKKDSSPLCPQCGGAELELSDCGISTLAYGIEWPPIA